MAFVGHCNKSMIRDTYQLSRKEYDVLVLGGGIYGAFTCWDAASRGLNTALVEKYDFGGATSAASLKVIHGGLRYLQSGNLILMRLMKQEQRNWMNIAPHIINPISCVMPTYKKITRSLPIFRAAILINNSVDWSKNLNSRPDKRLTYGYTYTRDEILNLLDGIDKDQVTGGVTWTEAYIENPSRLLISVLQSASEYGADIANHVEATRLLTKESRVLGIHARDNQTGQDLEIRAKVTINCMGAWVDDILESTRIQKSSKPYFKRSIAINLVTRRKTSDNILMGFSSKLIKNKNSGHLPMGPILFTLNWGKHTLYGTKHIMEDASRPQSIPEKVLQTFVDEINSGFPGGNLTMNDIVDVLWGYLPVKNTTPGSGEVQLVRDIQVIDHKKTDNTAGLITLIGVRYTLARYIAEKCVNLAVLKIGKVVGPCKTAVQPIWGGHIQDYHAFQQEIKSNLRATFESDVIDQLIHSYGTNYEKILQISRRDPNMEKILQGNKPVLEAEIIHAIRDEMAITLTDLIRRRTELAPIGMLSEDTLRCVCKIIGNELKWDAIQTQKALQELSQDSHHR